MLFDEVVNVGTQWNEAFEALKEVTKSAFEKTPFWKSFSEGVEKSAKQKVQQKQNSKKKGLDKMTPELQKELFESDLADEIDEQINQLFPWPTFGEDVIRISTYAAQYNEDLETQDKFFTDLKKEGEDKIKQLPGETVADWSMRCWKKQTYIPKYHYTVQIKDDQGHRAENKPMAVTLYDPSSGASLETLTRQSVFSPSVTLTFRLAKVKVSKTNAIEVKPDRSVDDISHRVIWKADAVTYTKKRWNDAPVTDVSYNSLIPE